MNISKNSFLIKIYRWTYSVSDYKLATENNLCPIFWKTIIAVFLLIPNLIIGLPGHIFDHFIDKNKYWEEKMTEKIKASVVVYLIIYLLSLCLSPIIAVIMKSDNWFVSLSDAKLWVKFYIFILMLVVSYILGRKIHEIYKQRKKKKINVKRIERVEKKSIIIAGIKAWYKNIALKLIGWSNVSQSKMILNINQPKFVL